MHPSSKSPLSLQFLKCCPLTFGAHWSGGSFQTTLARSAWFTYGACPAWEPIFSRRSWGARSALRGFHVCRRHLGQEVGKFGYGIGEPETFVKNGLRMRDRVAAHYKLEIRNKTD